MGYMEGKVVHPELLTLDSGVDHDPVGTEAAAIQGLQLHMGSRLRERTPGNRVCLLSHGV